MKPHTHHHDQPMTVVRHASTARRRRLFSVGTAVAGLAMVGSVHAIEFGPDGMFTLNGFAEVTVTRANNQCPSSSCQLSPETNRHLPWADAIKQGLPLENKDSVFSQTQLWLGAKYDLGNGFKAKGTLSQNWRDGKADTPGFWRDKNIEISHEYYGTLTVGHMVTRTWMFSDYPYGSNIGLSYSWAGTGAGYRNLTRAVRYTSRVLDIAEGDVVLEATYDSGDSGFKVNKPRFVELWAHYGKDKLSLDAMYQDSRNGVPSAFGAAVFNGPFYDSAADGKLGNSGQSVTLLQAIYQYSPKIEISGAVRHNRWSGAYAVAALPGPQWNFPFNIDWFGSINGVPHPGYAARSTDFSMGVRYRMDKWTLGTGLAYMGKASTQNPTERGQSNSALINTLYATYKPGNGLELSVFGGVVHFKNKGLAPLSMPSNSMINGIDSRVTKAGNWLGVGAKYSF